MLYVPSSTRPEWTAPALLGSITGVRTKLRHHAEVDARPQVIRRRESTSSLLVQQGEKLGQIKGLYSLRDAAFVMGFLRIYPGLIDLLLEAPTYLERYFGPNPQVVLEIVVDPESEDSEELFANIRTSLPVEEHWNGSISSTTCGSWRNWGRQVGVSTSIWISYELRLGRLLEASQSAAARSVLPWT